MRFHRLSGLVLSAIVAVGFSASARAGTELIQNGNFTNLTSGTAGYTSAWLGNGGSESLSINNWTYGAGGVGTGSAGGYDFVYNSAAQATGTGAYFDPCGNGGCASQKVMTAGVTNSPVGGNFLAVDSDASHQSGVTANISQTVGGLTVGQQYTLSFYWAAGTQSGFNSATTNSWQATFGSAAQTTSVVSVPAGGFSGWTESFMVFTAAATSQVLSFLAIGAPNGTPPYALLDGVSLQAGVPEPASWVLLIGGLAAVTSLSRLRRRTSQAA